MFDSPFDSKINRSQLITVQCLTILKCQWPGFDKSLLPLLLVGMLICDATCAPLKTKFFVFLRGDTVTMMAHMFKVPSKIDYISCQILVYKYILIDLPNL